tara:strand:- start:16603 stop:17763 length:1161 start_codon:yes stop_codon:yes gene_type:complete
MKICVVTGTRADYGLLYWIIKALSEDSFFSLQICATGMHLSPEFGLTYRAIENDGFEITSKIETLLSSDSTIGISKSIGLGVISFSEEFERLKPDLILVVGDRFEIFSVATAAMISKIPIAHCHGGESTEGLIDEPIRHSITKMSHIHFTSTNEYLKRVIQLGESPNSVFNVGALGIENIKKLKLLSKYDFEKAINFKLSKINFLVTFHPVTLENQTAEIQFLELLKSLKLIKDSKIIFTKPNADSNGRPIIKLIDEFVINNPNRSISFISMGQLNYLSCIQFVDAVIGNSSSGLIEVPSFNKPTINIGDRQMGRIKSNTVIQCDPNQKSISNAIEIALSKKFKLVLKNSTNPYDNGNSSEKIVKTLKNISLKNIIKKNFFNINIK